MHSLRRYKLNRLLNDRFGGDRGRLLKEAKLSKARLSQLLAPDQPFGDVAAKNLEERLHLDAGYFDAMDAQTVEWAVKFDSLPTHMKARWLELVDMLSGKPK